MKSPEGRYQPSEDEIRAAEESMTPKQREMSDERVFSKMAEQNKIEKPMVGNPDYNKNEVSTEDKKENLNE